jgi:hypothetical protein
MDDRTYIDQTKEMMRELATLRNVNHSQANTIGLLRRQYDDLATDFDEAVAKHKDETRQLRHQRDVAERKADDVNAILQVVAKHTVEGLRAMKDDSVEPAATVGNVHKIDPNTVAQRTLRASMMGDGDQYIDRETGSNRRYD